MIKILYLAILGLSIVNTSFAARLSEAERSEHVTKVNILMPMGQYAEALPHLQALIEDGASEYKTECAWTLLRIGTDLESAGRLFYQAAKEGVEEASSELGSKVPYFYNMSEEKAAKAFVEAWRSSK